MDVERSRHEYERRIHRVLAYIDANLAAPLDLETLAGVAHFSPFHFHRLFRAWCGETLADYVRRRRIELAAARLALHPQLSVLQVALDAGFGSGEAFTRAFRQRFGVAPSVWRRGRAPGRSRAGLHPLGGSTDVLIGRGADISKFSQGERKIDQAAAPGLLDDGGSFTHAIEAPMNVTLTDRAPTPIAYFRHTGPYGADVGRFWMEQLAPWLEANQLFERPRYGIAHDDPTVTAPAQCRYDACVELAADAVVSGQPQRTVLPGGRYACLRFEGTSETIDAAWRNLLREWLPGSGLQLDARPFFEHYPADSAYDPATGVFDCELCIPVRPL